MESDSSETLGFAFKTAPVGRRLRVSVTAERLRVEDASSGRVLADLSLAGISAGRWTDATAKPIYMPAISAHYLLLHGAEGTAKIRYGERGRGAKAGGELAVFYGACVAALSHAARANPALQITIGSKGYVRWLMGALGLAALLLGALVLFASIGAAMARDWENLGFFIALGLALGGMGASMAITYNPLRKQPSVSAAALAAELAARAKKAGA